MKNRNRTFLGNGSLILEKIIIYKVGWCFCTIQFFKIIEKYKYGSEMKGKFTFYGNENEGVYFLFSELEIDEQWKTL